MPEVSIIIPVYKVEKYISRCIESVLGQTFADWEAVCVNDGSPDGSRDILAGFAERDLRIRIIDKPNGGLSDARNAGIRAAGGKYVVFLDSDDFIHPQTLEIAVSLARRTGTDIVSWYKDPNYRNIAIIRHKLGLDTMNFRPASFRKKFNAEKVRYHVTHDIYAHATELSHPRGIEWPVKHFYVVRHLIRREIIEDVPFIKGITFEDFPWWSAVMLKNPSVTITYLPFYYYYPNFSSIDMGSTRIRKITNWCIGLEKTVALYRKEGNGYQIEKWSRNCKWPVINGQIAKHLGEFDPKAAECAEASERLRELWEAGAFSDAQDKADRKSVRVIRAFIGLVSK